MMFFGGRISIAKGSFVAVDLLIELSKTITNLCLLVVGQEDDRVSSLVARAKLAGLGDRVKFTGWLSREEIISAYYAAHIVLVPSLYLDPFPTVNLEAMASKKPIIGTCFGGTPEAVIHNETGFIVDPNNLDSTVGCARTVLESAELGEKFGQAGYDRALNKFALVNQIDALEKLYDGHK